MKFALPILFLLALALPSSVSAQLDRYDQIRNQLESVVVDQPGLDMILETSVSNVGIAEYLRSLGLQNEINLSVASDLEGIVSNNFNNVRILDVIVFLCKEFDLDIEIIGGIIAVRKYEPYLPPPPEEQPLTVEVDSLNGFVSFEFKNDSLSAVAKALTNTGISNVIIGEGLTSKRINAYIKNRPLLDAVDKLCVANGLIMEEEEGFVILKAPKKEERNAQTPQELPPISLDALKAELKIDVKDSLVSLDIREQNIGDVIELVSREMGVQHFMYTRPDAVTTIHVKDVSYDQFLTHVLHATPYSFIIEDEVYLIGDQQNDGITITELVSLQRRTIENVFASYGGGRQNTGNRNRNNGNQTGTNGNNTGFNSGRSGGAGAGGRGGGGVNPFQNSKLQIEAFPELNSFVVTGSLPEVRQFKQFIASIDQVVPVVVIEVLIVDVNKSNTMSAGVNAGIGENAGTTQGPITGTADQPGLNVDLSTESINELINGFNGLGVVNLGNVTPNFYLSIQAMETDGLLRTRSTPKLATLNSYPASLRIGREEYYLQTNTTVSPGTNATVVSEQQDWRPLNADLAIDIVPVVSGEEHVTLDISVIQSNFTERAGANGPFGSVNREFTSSIRVKNGDMILLGGLEDKSVSNSGGGLPGIARIPVLRWFFGSRTRSAQDTKLNIFIRPMIMY
ncbi:MAG: type II and III secretion system protein [Flavobacteriales bacterium]|nr:type II and III secretion system protein [Flavobacteriales bacterium]